MLHHSILFVVLRVKDISNSINKVLKMFSRMFDF